jgi:A/G-specific adenine glycosylase
MARYVVDELGGVMPDSTAGLLKLPGVGPYIARAVACFAYGHPVPLVDGVAGRVYRRVLGLTGSGYPGCDREVWRAAERLVPEEDPRSFNYAMLDIGAIFCKPRNPACTGCPLRCHCASVGLGGNKCGQGPEGDQQAGHDPCLGGERTLAAGG